MERFAIAFSGTAGAGLDGSDCFVVQQAADSDGTDVALLYDIHDVLCFSGSAVSDNGNADCSRHFAAEFKVEAFSGAFAIDGSGKDFTGSQLFGLHCPLQGIDAGMFASVIREGQP
jgi:hypothetical protein